MNCIAAGSTGHGTLQSVLRQNDNLNQGTNGVTPAIFRSLLQRLSNTNAHCGSRNHSAQAGTNLNVGSAK